MQTVVLNLKKDLHKNYKKLLQNPLYTERGWDTTSHELTLNVYRKQAGAAKYTDLNITVDPRSFKISRGTKESTVSTKKELIQIINEFWNEGPSNLLDIHGSDIEFIEGTLANNEVSSDDELVTFFHEQTGVPADFLQGLVTTERPKFFVDMWHEIDWVAYKVNII